MLLLKEPNDGELRKLIKHFSKLSYSYRHPGFTRATGECSGFVVDHNRALLGSTDEDWDRARKAIRDWKMFHQDWIKLCWPYKQIKPGVTVAILASHFGFWSVSGARIIYSIDEEDCYGFAYGTTTSHMERGEERFLVERLEDGSVWFDLYAVSRPQHLMAKLFYPITRRLQRKFAKGAVQAMRTAMERPAVVKAGRERLRKLF